MFDLIGLVADYYLSVYCLKENVKCLFAAQK